MNWRIERRQRNLERRREEVLALARERGVTIERRGQAWHLRGPGVDIACTDLAMLDADDFEPTGSVPP